MKKRMMAATLALVMLLALLAGCAGGDPKGTVEPLQSVQPDVDETLPSPEASEPADDDGDSEELFQAGTAEGGTYTNEMLGLGCTLDEEWTFASEEEIAAAFGMAKELIEQAETGVELEDAQTFTDLYVYADAGARNINIQVQTLGALEGGIMGSVSEETILDNVLPVLEETVASAYAGFGTVTCEKADARFLDEDHKVVAMVTTAQDMELYQKQVYLPCGRYVAIVTCTSVGEDTTDELLELFYKV